MKDEKDEKTLLAERLKEIEEELFVLKSQEEKRADLYNKRIQDMEVKKIEEELLSEEKALKELYPDFDAEKELENETFRALLNQGISMKTAFEALNLDKIKKEGEKSAGKRAVESFKKLSLRPDENGAGKKEGAVLKSGVFSLSKKERQDLAKRAQKGEIITF